MVLSFLFFRVLGLIQSQRFKPPFRQTLEAYPGLTAALSSTLHPSYHIVENSVPVRR